MTLTFGSLFAGIGGFDLGLERAAMVCKWQVEIDPFCRRVLAKHWPDVERFEDVRECGKHNLEAVDLICGGFPCQDLSVAGKREGISGKRSGLWFEFHRVLAKLRPRWAVIENVPGLLSSNGGADFAVLLRGLVELGYGVCWRVLDAQYFGVAQRRRRVFIVGSLRNGRAAQVLFESEGSTWDSPPSRETGERIAAPLKAGTPSRRGGGSWPIAEKFVFQSKASASQSMNPSTISPSLDACKSDGLTVYSRQITSGGGKPGQGYPCVAYDLYNGIETGDVTHTVQAGAKGHNYSPHTIPHVTAYGLDSHATTTSEKAGGFGVRRLTPTECERLQGIPDGWTDVNGMSDSARYRMLGNAVARVCAEWLGQRIMEVEAR